MEKYQKGLIEKFGSHQNYISAIFMNNMTKFIPALVFGSSLLLGVFVLIVSYQYRMGNTPEIFQQEHSSDCPNGWVDVNHSRCVDPYDHDGGGGGGGTKYWLECTSLTASATSVTPGQVVNFTLKGATNLPANFSPTISGW